MFFKRKLKPYKVTIKYEYVANEYDVDVVIRNVTEIEFAKSKQKLYKKLKKKFKYSNILYLNIEEMEKKE